MKLKQKLSKFFNLKEIRESFGLTQLQLASLLYISKRSIEEYEAGKKRIPRPVFELLRYKVFELNFHLTDTDYKKYADSRAP